MEEDILSLLNIEYGPFLQILLFLAGSLWRKATRTEICADRRLARSSGGAYSILLCKIDREANFNVICESGTHPTGSTDVRHAQSDRPLEIYSAVLRNSNLATQYRGFCRSFQDLFDAARVSNPESTDNTNVASELAWKDAPQRSPAVASTAFVWGSDIARGFWRQAARWLASEAYWLNLQVIAVVRLRAAANLFM